METSATADSTSDSTASLLFPLDIEHAGIRLALPVVMLGSGFLAFLLASPLMASISAEGSGNCLAIIVAVAVGVVVTGLADRLMKRIWPSQRNLRLDDQAITLLDNRKNRPREIAIAWDKRINILVWRFTVKRGSSRVQKGWSMLGCQIAQDEAQFSIYTFAPPKIADDPKYATFKQLVPRTVLEKGDFPLREANQLRRLLRAEDDRWMNGAEMRREDFEVLLETLSEKAPDWQDNLSY